MSQSSQNMETEKQSSSALSERTATRPHAASHCFTIKLKASGGGFVAQQTFAAEDLKAEEKLVDQINSTILGREDFKRKKLFANRFSARTVHAAFSRQLSQAVRKEIDPAIKLRCLHVYSFKSYAESSPPTHSSTGTRPTAPTETESGASSSKRSGQSGDRGKRTKVASSSATAHVEETDEVLETGLD